jgi:hypothetical protein
MNIWIGVLLIAAVLYVAIDYGRLVIKCRRYENNIDFIPEMPTLNIMVTTKNNNCIASLSEMNINAHIDADWGIKAVFNNESTGCIKTYFENEDIQIVYNYENAVIEKLTKAEIDNHILQIFFDNELPEGAERAVIKKLGLLDYMVKIGICSDKNGGK